jgi:hypothetical protein
MARTPNDYGTMGPQSTAPNPTQRSNGMKPPGVPGSHAQTVSPGSTALPRSDPQALADRVRGGKDPSNGDASGANRQAR